MTGSRPPPSWRGPSRPERYPDQLSVARSIADRRHRMSAVDREGTDLTVSIGAGGTQRLDEDTAAATLAAWELATALETTPDPVLALAGIVAAGLEPTDTPAVLEAAEGRIKQVPGLVDPHRRSDRGYRTFASLSRAVVGRPDGR
ncbi:MAG: hypothetical protein U5K37_01800 [Natrialbaceae archaeon]|nr:hypothetical protein [Natrialbaceae archaeon]